MTLATVALATATALTACGTETGSGGGSGTETGSGGANGSETGAGSGSGAGGDLAGGSDVPNDAITNGRWVPETITVEGREVTRPAWADDAYLRIRPGTTSDAGGESGGFTGCNHTGADVEIEGDRLNVSDHVSTRMACTGDAEDFEEHFVDVFRSSPQFELSESGEELTLTADNGDSVFLVRAADQTA